MKSVRWRKIIKVTKFDATRLMSIYYHNEHAEMVWGSSVIGEKREMEILNTLHDYANTIERTAKVETHLLNQDWIDELSNFSD